jgi:mRNA-degrading endonuclease RelE of RelBE toxin-antitoxin system
MSRYSLSVREQVKGFFDALGMSYRRDVKRILVKLLDDQGDIKALGDDLEGFYRLRVGPFRIIFRYREGKVIECVYMNRRALVYEVFEREVVERLKTGEK